MKIVVTVPDETDDMDISSVLLNAANGVLRGLSGEGKFLYLDETLYFSWYKYEDREVFIELDLGVEDDGNTDEADWDADLLLDGPWTNHLDAFHQLQKDHPSDWSGASVSDSEWTGRQV